MPPGSGGGVGLGEGDAVGEAPGLGLGCAVGVALGLGLGVGLAGGVPPGVGTALGAGVGAGLALAPGLDVGAGLVVAAGGGSGPPGLPPGAGEELSQPASRAKAKIRERRRSSTKFPGRGVCSCLHA